MTPDRCDIDLKEQSNARGGSGWGEIWTGVKLGCGDARSLRWVSLRDVASSLLAPALPRTTVTASP